MKPERVYIMNEVNKPLTATSLLYFLISLIYFSLFASTCAL